jgi:arylsulfatase A-like enzyme
MPTVLPRTFSLLVLALGFSAAAAEKPAGKPNVILIYSDDHGWADLGAQGADADIRTPHLDAMAREGVRFTRGYVSAPQCVPSRAGVITGRYQQRFGVEDNLKGPLPLAELTIAERLKPAGYVSAQVGKWHLEPTPRSGPKTPGENEFTYLPGGQGFDEYFTGPMNSFVASHDLKGNALPKAPQRLSDPRFRCVWQTDAAVSFIERHPRDPFFLYLAYFTPHVPLESPEPWFAKTPAHLPKERRQALAMMAAMDDGIGRIRTRLRELGLEQNTLVFFIGDNGAPLKAGAWNGSLNTPLTGEKGMLTDGGVRVPFVAAWPGTLPAGQVYDRPVIALDVAATAIALAGLPTDPALDGVNLMPFLLGQKSGSPHDALYWRWRSQAAVRTDRWKLILLGSQKFLFDLESPEAETKNRLADFPAVAAELEKKLLAWNATLPPPGLPRELNAQDQIFFDAHVNQTGATVVKRGAEKGAARKGAGKGAPTESTAATQGWVGRNCTLTTRDGALQVAAAGGANAKAGKPFLTHPGLDLPGPVTATVQLRTRTGGTVGLAWRTAEQPDFTAENHTSQNVTGSAEWQTVTLTLPSQARVIHVRLHLPGGAATEIRRIELRGAGSEGAKTWDFAASPR